MAKGNYYEQRKEAYALVQTMLDIDTGICIIEDRIFKKYGFGSKFVKDSLKRIKDAEDETDGLVR